MSVDPAFSFMLLGVETPFFSLSSVPLIGITGALALYFRACSILAARGRIVPLSQKVSYCTAMAMMLVATSTFIDPVGEEALLSLHMLQHLMIADLPAPFLLYGIRAPVLYFFWPKPVIKRVARMIHLRALWRWLRRPHIALSVWLLTLYAWHIPFFYEAALSNCLVHDLEHISFALTGVLAWWPLMDPTHERVEGRVWKAGYIVAARMIGGFLGSALVLSRVQVYGAYGDASRMFGIDPLVDQQIAGGMMMIVDSVIIIVAATFFLVSMDRGAEFENDLLEPTVAAAIARATIQPQGSELEKSNSTSSVESEE